MHRLEAAGVVGPLAAWFVIVCGRVFRLPVFVLLEGFVAHEFLIGFWRCEVCACGTEEAFTHQRTSLRNWINADVGSLTGLLFAAWTIT